ncbi:hypothetical protein HDU86_000791 [Geranomyces michiganensis]|nr:hypothetical protein HDU86_000791 [Geranomyces michiganensis]
MQQRTPSPGLQDSQENADGPPVTLDFGFYESLSSPSDVPLSFNAQPTHPQNAPPVSQLDLAPPGFRSTIDKLLETYYWIKLLQLELARGTEARSEMYFVLASEAIFSTLDIFGNEIHEYILKENEPHEDVKAVRKRIREFALHHCPVIKDFSKLHPQLSKKANPLLTFSYAPHMPEKRFTTPLPRDISRSATCKCCELTLQVPDDCITSVNGTVNIVFTILKGLLGETATQPMRGIVWILHTPDFPPTIPASLDNIGLCIPFKSIVRAYDFAITQLGEVNGLHRAWNTLGHLGSILDEAVIQYQHPLHFRWFLNAFVMFSRVLTLMLQAKLNKTDGFKEWWSKIVRPELEADKLLQNFNDARKVSVHERALELDSIAGVGLFKHGRRPKAIICVPALHHWTFSELNEVSEGCIDSLGWISDDQNRRGFLRYWCCSLIGDISSEITEHLDSVLNKLLSVLVQTQQKYGASPPNFTDDKFLPSPPPPPIYLFATTSEENKFNGCENKWPGQWVRHHDVVSVEEFRTMALAHLTQS